MSSSEEEIVEIVEYSKTINTSNNGKSAFDSPCNKTASFSKSNEKIYRTKFRQRFHVKKIQARKTRTTLEKHTGGLKGVKRLTQTIQKENDAICSELKNYNIKTKTNNNQLKLINEFDFFTREEELEKYKKVAENVDYLVKFLPQKLNDLVELSETKHFWKPSRSMPPLFDKIGTNNRRFLSEEGIYAETLPSIMETQRNMLEQRLIVENDKKWFNCEGNLKITRAPLEHALSRPFGSDGNIVVKKYSRYVDVVSQFEGVTIEKENVLEMYVQYLKFQHHPLFSPQHVLQNRLIYHYTLFKRKEDENKIDRITKRLNYLRNTKTNLENYLEDTQSDNDQYYNAIEKMYKTIKEIHKLRGELLDERVNQRETVKNILETWKMLKRVRKMDGYISTPIKLIIIKEKGNYSQDRRYLDKEIKLLFYEIKYEKDFLKDNRNLFNNKEHHNEFDWISKEEHLSFNKIKNKYEKCFREPGEPIVNFFIEYDQEIITKVVEDKNEKLRRNVVRGTKISFKLFHKGTEICKSKIIEMDDNFFCEFNEKLAMKKKEKISEPVTIELYEQSGYSYNTWKKKLCETNLTLPLQLSTLNMLENFIEIEHEHVPQKYNGVGSGESVKKLFFEKYNLILGDDLKLSTSAIISYGIEWTLKGDVCSYSSKTDNEMEKLFDTFNNSASSNKNDPQDPKYSRFDNVLIENRNGEIHSHSEDEESIQRFHYNFHLRPLKFCKHKEIKTNDRLTMLQLRDKNVPQFYGLGVPINEKEINKTRENYKQVYPSLIEKDYVTKTEGLAILREIYFQVFQKCRNTDINLSYDDVVNEHLLRHFENYINQMINCTFSWLTLHSCLNLIPYNKMNFKETSMTSSKSETLFELRTPLKILVTIRSVLNVPKRTRIHVHRDKDEHAENNFDDFYLRLCVVIKHSNKTIESEIVKSSNTIWNETLVLEVETLNVDCMSPNFLCGSISLHLFDVLSSEERIWLGSTEINISSIYESDMLEGVFQLETPALSFVYEPENSTNLHPLFTPISLSLLIRAQPFTPRLHISMEKLESNETPRLRNYILQWNERYNESFPHRTFSALAIDIHGRTSCVTRYMTPIEPPQLNRDTFQVTPHQLAKYFSKFPFTDNNNKFYQNIWLTAKQFLNIMVGSMVDHAVTLACCLESLDLQVWLLLGNGIPNGSSAYVLTRESTSTSYYIFDVTTGIKYNILDNLSPLQRIYCVINGKNVWANIQTTDKVEKTLFDLSKTSDWLPLFTDKIPAPSISLQQQIVYTRVTNEHYLFENKVEKKIYKKIAKLKKFETTKLNSSLSKAFKKVMLNLKNGCFSDQLDFDMAQDILAIQLSHKCKMKGFLICKTYNGLSSLFEFINDTDLLKPQRADSEYVLATQVISWPNQIIILWILIGVVY